MSKKIIKNVTHNGVIDVWDYVSFEEYPNQYGKRIYLDIQGLVDSAEYELKKNKRYKNYTVESFGVDKWGC